METQTTLFTPQQAANYVGVNYRTILSWINSGELECYRIGDGRSIRIDQNQINDYLANHKSSNQPAGDAKDGECNDQGESNL